MKDRLFQEILMARQRVYAVDQPTPLEAVSLPVDAEVFVKREDLSSISSFKWRGAYNRMAELTTEQRAPGIVTASAGNHAQGVAVAAARLGIDARIYMPQSTPRMKQVAVRRYGGERVEIVLHGDHYHAAAERAFEDVKTSGSAFVHAYDDFGTMGGQGTLADEIVMSGHGPFDVAYVQIGGGGLAASMACWLKTYYPGIRVVGVEGEEQASMAAAIEAGGPVALDYADVFCDGTAVKQTGANTFSLCSDLLDEFITVTNEEVCNAIQLMWESQHCIPEPSGAMGLAGLLKQGAQLKGQRAVCVITGANLDFGQLAWIGRHADIGGGRRRYFRFTIGERPGTMLELLETAMEGVNIIEFQYGKVDREQAWPVIGFEASPAGLDLLEKRLREIGIPHEDIVYEEDVEFRIIHYEPDLFSHPYFFKIEFPERPGALHDFLDMCRTTGNLCYFNYVFTGEQVGRAMLGFEFETEDMREAFQKNLRESGHTYYEISDSVLKRVL